MVVKPTGVVEGARPPAALPPDRLINRELAWLAFNERVLAEAADPEVPLLERLKFLAIFSANMDEFFMVRVAGLKRMIDAGVEAPFPDGLTPARVQAAVAARCAALAARQNAVFREEIRPALERAGVRILAPGELSPAQATHLGDYFRRTILPVTTPLAVDPAHPFPHLGNRAICLVVRLLARDASQLFGGPEATALVPVPAGLLPRFLRLPAPVGRHELLLLEDALRLHLDQLFQGYVVEHCGTIRVTRDMDLVIDEENAGDLLTTIEAGLRARRQGAAVRLHHDDTLSPATVELLRAKLGLAREDVYAGRGLVGFADFMQLRRELDLPALQDPPLAGQAHPELEAAASTFDVVRERDVLLHHPYQRFDHVVRFVREAADDPAVLAIKMTLYRTGGGASPIVDALCRAARNGKQVAVLMELRARFDEQANIEGARRLQDAGAHVMYGLVGLKTHAKVCVVVRREPDGIRAYAHLGTGNYDARTASLYVDYGLLTARREVTEDLTHVFNVITGYSRPEGLRHVVMSPFALRSRLLWLIDRERAHAQAGRPARIVAQLNALVDPEAIDALYHAGRAGVAIELVVRGICCLRPGVPGLSETIRVVRIVDRFLEHARALHVANGGEEEVYLSSADWAPRNLDRRIELLFPVLDPALRARLIDDLRLRLQDDWKGHPLDADGRDRPGRGRAHTRSQLLLHATRAPEGPA